MGNGEIASFESTNLLYLLGKVVAVADILATLFSIIDLWLAIVGFELFVSIYSGFDENNIALLGVRLQSNSPCLVKIFFFF